MNTDHFIKNPAFSTAKMTVDERGLIVFDCQIIVYGSRKCCLLKLLRVRQFYFSFRIAPIRYVAIHPAVLDKATGSKNNYQGQPL